MLEENGNGLDNPSKSVRKIIALGSNIITWIFMAYLSFKTVTFVIPPTDWLLFLGAINMFYFGKDFMRNLSVTSKTKE